MSHFNSENASNSEYTYENQTVNNSQFDSAVNMFNKSNSDTTFDNSQYTRLITQGRCFKLPSTPTISDELYQSWLFTFMTEVKDDVNEISRSFRYTWCDEDENVDATKVAYGIPGSPGQVVKMIKANQIIPEMLDPKPSAANWDKLKKITDGTWALQSVVNEDIGTKDTKPLLVKETDKSVRKIFDQIINLISNNFYEAAAALEWTGEMPGGVAQLFFDDHRTILKIMRSAHAEGNKFLPNDMVTSWNKGVYKSYKQVIAAVKRRYGRCQTQDSMMDFFRKLDNAFARKTRHEFKLQELRNIIEKHLIVDPSEFPTCSDFENDSSVQSHPEGFTCMIVSLLQYIMIKNEVPKNKWDDLQKEYVNTFNGKSTYKSWHENRKDFWTKLDEATSITHRESINNVDGQCSENCDDQEDDIDEILAIVKRRRQQQQRNGRTTKRNYANNTTNNNNSYRNHDQNRNRFTPSYNRNTAVNKNSSKPSKQWLRTRIASLLCLHCSRIAGINKYHEGPYGGGPESLCPYDKSGKSRPGKRFVSHIFDTSVNELGIPDLKEADEGLVYEDEQKEEVNHLDLLTGALSQYQINE